MKRSSLFKYIILVVGMAWYLGSGCANIGSPTGGFKDTIPPELLSIYPKLKSLNVKDNVIRLAFNENINVKDFQSQLIISPRTDNTYKTKVNKNTVEISFDKPLQDSTTYTFNFRKGIVDITEGNPAKDLYLAFSTGSYIDSLSVEGQVRSALQDMPVEGATVALYNALDTMVVTKNKPVYLGKTDKEGRYNLLNLKQGRYLLYAYVDKNSNLTLQTRSEAYGYWPDTLNLSTAVDSINIDLFNANADKPSVISTRPSGNYFEITFNKPLLEYQLQLEGRDSVASNFIENNKKVRIYPFPLQDSISATVIAQDSLQQQLTHNFSIRFEESKRQKPAFTAEINPPKGTLMPEDAKITLQFTKPVARFDLDSVVFRYDTLNAEAVSVQNLEWNKRRDKVVIRKQLTPPKQQQAVTNVETTDAATLARGGAAQKDQQVELIIPKGSLISLDTDTLDNQAVNYRIAKAGQTGIINGVVQTEAQNFIVQLVKGKNMNVVKEIQNTRQYSFKFVEPGEYSIRVIIDSNGNGRWDPGNIHTLEAPEEAYVYPKPITIKANWEINNPEILL